MSKTPHNIWKMLRFYPGCLFATFFFCSLHKKQIRWKDSWYRHTVILSGSLFGEKTARKGKGKGEGGGGESMWTNIRRPLFRPLVIILPIICRWAKIVICQLISRVSKSWENYQEMSGVLLRLKTELNHGVQASLSICKKSLIFAFPSPQFPARPTKGLFTGW